MTDWIVESIQSKDLNLRKIFYLFSLVFSREIKRNKYFCNFVFLGVRLEDLSEMLLITDWKQHLATDNNYNWSKTISIRFVLNQQKCSFLQGSFNHIKHAVVYATQFHSTQKRFRSTHGSTKPCFEVSYRSILASPIPLKNSKLTGIKLKPLPFLYARKYISG